MTHNTPKVFLDSSLEASGRRAVRPANTTRIPPSNSTPSDVLEVADDDPWWSGLTDGLRRRLRISWSPPAVVAAVLVCLAVVGGTIGWGVGGASGTETVLPPRDESAQPRLEPAGAEGDSQKASGSDNDVGSQSPSIDFPEGGVPLAESLTPAADNGRNPADDSNKIFVHVAGKVRAPGVVVVPGKSRVADAIEAAGGLSSKAAAWRVNLARVVQDGEQVYVPDAEEDLPTLDQAGDAAQRQAPPTSQQPPSEQGNGLAEKVNINKATAGQLQQLDGIGPVLAGRIVNHRQTQGTFTSPEDLQSVPGIGATTLSRLLPHITV